MSHHAAEAPEGASRSARRQDCPKGCTKEVEEAQEAQEEVGACLLPEEQMEELLYRQGFPTELLELKQQQEERVLARLGSASLPPKVRETCLQAMLTMTMQMNMTPSDWFLATAVFDALCQRSPDGKEVLVRLPQLPVTVVAIVRLVRKFETVDKSCYGQGLTLLTKELACRLGLTGPMAEVSLESIMEHEQTVLKALEWQISIPTVESWVTSFAGRFDTLTLRFFSQPDNPMVPWVVDHVMYYARVLTFREVTGATVPPRRLAMGLLGLGFVTARLLHLDALRLPQCSPDAWVRAYLQSQPQRETPVCMLEAPQALRLFNVLQVAMRATSYELQEAAWTVAAMLQEPVALIQKMQQQPKVIHTSL